MVVALFSVAAREGLDVDDHRRASARMREIVSTIPGSISCDSCSGEGGEAVTAVRFASASALRP